MTSTWDELKFYGQLARNLFTRSYDLHKVPGPPGYWGLGHIPKIMRPDYHVQILEWANEYGGVFKFSLGCQWVVVVSDPAIATQVLGRGAGSVPRKCVGYHFFDLATNHLGRRSFFTTTDEQQWQTVRKAAAPAFAMANVRKSYGHVLKHANGIADHLAVESRPSIPAQNGHINGHMNGHAAGSVPAVDIQEHLELGLLNVFVEALFGIPAEDFPGHEVAAAMNLVLEEANERLKVPLRGLATYVTKPKAYAAVRQAQELLGQTYGRLADEVLSRGPPPEDDTTLWACLARMKHPKTGKPWTREQLIPEIGAFMMAGFDTSSHTIAWCLFVLATNSDIQAKVQQELDERGLLHGPGRNPRQPTMDDLSRLPYLNCVIDECMRMYPVAATASVREVEKPTKVGQYTIPQGVIVWPMLYALHNSHHNWQHPEEFRPERWAEKHYTGKAAHSRSGSDSDGSEQASMNGSYQGNGQTISHTNGLSSKDSGESLQGSTASAGSTPGSHGKNKSFLPFSDGIKSCMGQGLGLMEVRTVLVVLCSRFNFALHSECGGAQQITNNMIMSLTLKLKGGLKLECHPLDAPWQPKSQPIPDFLHAAAPATPAQSEQSQSKDQEEDDTMAATSLPVKRPQVQMNGLQRHSSTDNMMQQGWLAAMRNGARKVIGWGAAQIHDVGAVH